LAVPLGDSAGGTLEVPPNERSRSVHLPRQPRRSFTIFDVNDAKQFIAAISRHKNEALFALAITTGGLIRHRRISARLNANF